MSDITIGGLSSLIHVEKTERFENQNLVVQVIKTKQSTSTNSLELHLSDKEHIFVGIIKINDPSAVPLYSIVRLKDFSINYPKRFLSILDFQVLDKSPNEIIISGKNLSYHPVYKKDQQQQQQNQQQNQQQDSQDQQPNHHHQQQQQQQQKIFRANTITPTKSLPIPKSNQGTRQPQSAGSSSSSSGFRQTTDPETLRSQPVTQISDISEAQKMLTIKVMVMSRMPMRTWDKPDSKGELFSVVLQDGSGEIKATCFSTASNPIPNFNELYDKFQDKKVLLIHNFSVKSANKSFNKLNHPYELTLNQSSVVLPIEEDIEVPYNFTPIGDLQGSENGFFDVIGVVTEVLNSRQEVISKVGNRLIKSNFNITDSTGTVEVVFWNDHADIDVKTGDILSIKSAKLNDYNNNKNLSASFCEINNFTLPQAAQLRSQNETHSLFSGPSISKANTSSGNYTNINLPLYVLKSLPESSELYKPDQKGASNKYQYRVVGHLFRPTPYIRNSATGNNMDDDKKYLDWFYDACTKCKKSNAGHEAAQCEGLDKEKNYKMQFKLADESESIQIDVLGSTCAKLLGVPANILDEYSQSQINQLFSTVLGPLYEVSIQITTYSTTDRDNLPVTYKRYNATHIQKVDTETFKNIIDDSFNQCRLFNRD